MASERNKAVAAAMPVAAVNTPGERERERERERVAPFEIQTWRDSGYRERERCWGEESRGGGGRGGWVGWKEERR